MSKNPLIVDFEPLLTCEQAAKFLSIAPSTLYEYASRNEVPHIVVRRGKRKRTIRFVRTDLLRWLREQTVLAESR